MHMFTFLTHIPAPSPHHTHTHTHTDMHLCMCMCMHMCMCIDCLPVVVGEQLREGTLPGRAVVAPLWIRGSRPRASRRAAKAAEAKAVPSG